jgi:hypothetical protein
MGSSANKVYRGVALVLALGFTPQWAVAAPGLSVSDGGLNGVSNRLWLVEVSPDPALFSDTPAGIGGSLAVELDFSVSGTDIVSATKNAMAWPEDNPGHNPFSGTITNGVVVDIVAGTVFVATGSDFFTTGNSVEVVTIVTLGSGATTLSWGGHTLLTGTPGEYMSARIAQAGMNFDGYQGSLVLGEEGATIGDLDCDGDVDFDDIGPFVLALTNAEEYLNQFGVLPKTKGDLDDDGDVDFDDIPGFVALLGSGGAMGAGRHAVRRTYFSDSSAYSARRLVPGERGQRNKRPDITCQ